MTFGVLLGLFTLWNLTYANTLADAATARALEQFQWPEPAVVPAAADQATIADLALPDDLKEFDPAGAPVIPQQAPGTTFAVLHAPRLGSDYAEPVTEGIGNKEVLDRMGIGHYPETAMPGAVGNFAIAAHRTTHGKPFADIDTLEVGDRLVVQTEQAWYVYAVTGSTVVTPEDVSVIAPVPNHPDQDATSATITLTSCHPRYSAAQRYVVWGELLYWAPAGHGYPRELLDLED